MKLFNYGFDNKEVRSLIVTSNIIGLTDLTAVDNHINSFAVIFPVKPVPYLHTVAVNRKSFVLLYIIYHQWDQLFRKPIRAVVVRATGNVNRHPVGVIERQNKVISTGFRQKYGLWGGSGVVSVK